MGIAFGLLRVESNVVKTEMLFDLVLVCVLFAYSVTGCLSFE